jgi:hypothetical protein
MAAPIAGGRARWRRRGLTRPEARGWVLPARGCPLLTKATWSRCRPRRGLTLEGPGRNAARFGARFAARRPRGVLIPLPAHGPAWYASALHVPHGPTRQLARWRARRLPGPGHVRPALPATLAIAPPRRRCVAPLPLYGAASLLIAPRS